MADLGDIGYRVKSAGTRLLGGYVVAVSNAATNTASAGTANANVLISAGSMIVGSCVANGSGVWSFHDLPPGNFYACEVGGAHGWSIEVAIDGSVTVTAYASGGGTPTANVLYWNPTTKQVEIADSVDLPSGVSVLSKA